MRRKWGKGGLDAQKTIKVLKQKVYLGKKPTVHFW